MATKSRSTHQKGLYTSYKASNRFMVNRKRKLTKLAKQQPNNEQIKAALDKIQYRRQTPKARHWSKSRISATMLLASFKKGVAKKFEFKVSEMGTIATRLGAQYVSFLKGLV